MKYDINSSKNQNIHLLIYRSTYFENIRHKNNVFIHTKTTLHPFKGLFSTTTCVSQHQKGRTIPDFNEARDDGMAVASAGPYTNHLHFAPDR